MSRAVPCLALPQGLDHRRFQPAAWLGPDLGVNHGVDRLVAHAGSGVIGMPAPQCRGNLLGRPVQIQEVVAHEETGLLPPDQFALRAAEQAALVIDALTPLRALGPLCPELAPNLPVPRSSSRPIVLAARPRSRAICRWLLPRRSSENITARSAPLRCFPCLSIKTPDPFRHSVLRFILESEIPHRLFSDLVRPDYASA